MANLGIHQIYILLVEPSKAQQRIINGYLEEMGATGTVLVQTAAEALEKMRSDAPDLVISAMHLADMTGTELVQTMRMEPALQAVPYMLISSETHYRYLEPIRQAGVIAILRKPFQYEQLKTAIDSTLHYLDPGEVSAGDLNGEDLRVLVVDDSFTARKHITRVLSNMGVVNITHAENGRQALDVVAREYFDLVVTDYNMPEMDGRELVEHIRASSAQASVPVLMVTSEADQSRLASVQQAGVSALCDKPFDSQTVKHLIEKIVA
jgi:two-component system chemotaxis response regulator CheY